MNRLLFLLISFCITCTYTIPCFAQIKTKRHYDYIDNKTNSANLRKVGMGGKYGCIDEEGNEVVNAIYDEIKYDESCNLILVQTRDKKWGMLTADAKHTIAYPKYGEIVVEPYAFNKHHCFIFRNYDGKWKMGIVNDRAEEIISPIYHDLYWLDEDRGYLRAELNGQYGIIDVTTRQFIIEPKYDDLAICYYGDTIVARKQNQVLLINLIDGKIIDTVSNDANSLFYGKYSFVIEERLSNRYILYSTLNKTPKTISGINPKKYDCNAFHIYYFFVSNIFKYYCFSEKWGEKKKYVDDLGRVYNDEEKAIQSHEEIKRLIETEREKRKKNIVQEEHNLASLKWLNYESSTSLPDYQLQLGIKSDSKIEEVGITVNGVLTRGINTVKSSEYDMSISQELHLNEGVNIIKVTVRNAAGTVQEEKTIVYRLQGGELPSIEWLDFAATSNKKEYTIKLGIKSKSKVEEVNVTINGTLTRGIKTVTANEYDLTVDRTLSLSEGINRIIVSVRNGDGISTSEKVITYQGNNPSPVFNDKRIAFVIGNSHYSNPEMNLLNPENDAQDVAMKLKTLGFEVTLKLDATLETMDKELSAFKDKAKDYDVAIFYYAGHGIQSKGVNYIIPTNIDNLAEDNMKYKCVNMEHVLDVMEDSHCKLKIVILDACRNDPLSRRWHRSAGTRGLSMMNAPTGTIISYSTGAGKTAQDGKGRNSPYTEAFLNTLDVPNLDVFHFFQKVGAEVKRKTGQAQDPWWSSSFTGDFFFNKQ